METTTVPARLSAEREAGRAAAAREDVRRLWEDHALGLVRLALVVTGDREAAEDVVQDVFLGFYRNHRRLERDDAALAYLRSAVLNRSRSVLRRRRPAAFFAKTYAPPAGSAESEALLGAEREAVLHALRRLPRRQREALVLRFYEDLGEADTAEVMGVSKGTVKSTTSRGLAALARMLEEKA